MARVLCRARGRQSRLASAVDDLGTASRNCEAFAEYELSGYSGNPEQARRLGYIPWPLLRKLRLVFSRVLATLLSGLGAAFLRRHDGHSRFGAVLGRGAIIHDWRMGVGSFDRARRQPHARAQSVCG